MLQPTSDHVKVRQIESPLELNHLAGHFALIFGCPCGDVITMRESLLCGGVCAGAYDGDQLVGGTWGMIGRDQNGPFDHAVAHAVLPKYQSLSIGERLDRFHIDWCRSKNIPRICWTFDPLSIPRARFSFNVLGAVGDGYIEDCYGPLQGILGRDTGHPGTVPSDRLHVTQFIDRNVTKNLLQEKSIPIPVPQGNRCALTNALKELQRSLTPLFDKGFVVTAVESDNEQNAVYKLRGP